MTSPRVPLNLKPYYSSDDPQTRILLGEIVSGRQERNEIARKCSEQWDRADAAHRVIANIVPVLDAAIELDAAEAAHDDPWLSSIGTEGELRLAREVFSAAVKHYTAGLAAANGDNA